MKNKNILEVNNISITLGSEVALSDISFSVKRGEALVIIGPNGAGKTVLFRALLGLIPHKGIISWAKNISIGYVPQKFPIEKEIPLSVQEFFLLQADYFWMPQKHFIDRLEHELSRVGLGKNILQKPIGDLSSGQLQRLLIAWAMLNHPDVLLFDEPTAGIDVGFEETIYNLIHRMQDDLGTTILLVSHDLNIVYRYAGAVLCINKKMVCRGHPREVLRPKELAELYGAGKFYIHRESENKL